MGTIRTTLCDPVLTQAEESLGKLCTLVGEVMDGEENFASGCKKYGLSYRKARQILYISTGIREPVCGDGELLQQVFPLPSAVEKLYMRVFNCRIKTDEIVDVIPSDAVETVKYIASHPGEFRLSSREGKIMECLYLEDLNYTETGKKFGLTNERIRQLEKRIIRKLACAPRRTVLYHGIGAYMRMQESIAEKKEAELLSLEEKCLHADTDLREAKKNLQEAMDAVIGMQDRVLGAREFSNIRVDELNLSVRSENSLKRAGVKNLAALMGMSAQEIANIPSIGKKSLEEITEKIHEFNPTW